jgi:hypothetical protein
LRGNAIGRQSHIFVTGRQNGTHAAISAASGALLQQ